MHLSIILLPFMVVQATTEYIEYRRTLNLTRIKDIFIPTQDAIDIRTNLTKKGKVDVSELSEEEKDKRLAVIILTLRPHKLLHNKLHFLQLRSISD